MKKGEKIRLLVYGMTALMLGWLMFPAPAPAQTTPAQIALNASMITVEPGVGSDDEDELVDEQEAFPSGVCYHSWENWGNLTYPQSVYLDLGREYVITAVHLFNHGGDGDFRVSSGTPGNWTVFVTDPLIGYTGWEHHEGLSVTTRYVRCTKTTDGKMAELVLFGYPAGEPGDEWTLTVLGAGAAGSVSKSPDLAAYPDGAAVTLTAAAAAGYVFKHWTEGADIFTANPLGILMDGDRTITAVFEPAVGPVYTLAVSVVGSGSVSPPGGTFEPYAITVLATPAAGWRFDHWEGDLTGSVNPQKLVMDRNRSVTAVFTPQPGGSSKLLLTPAMIRDEKTGGYADTPAANLVDEQAKAGDPRAGSGGAVTTFWLPSWLNADHPWSCYIDLGQTYRLTDIYIYDHPWKNGDFSVSYGTPGNWVVLFTDGLQRNDQWFGRQVNITSRYLRFTRHSATAFVDEVVLYGETGTADTIPPAAVTTLAATPVSSGSIALTWKATGDDGNSGKATLYDLRYGTQLVTESNWSNAIQAAGEPAPANAGTDQGMTITGLNPDTPYYFALRVFDDASNASGLSNSAQAKTLPGTTPQSKTFGNFMSSVYSMSTHADKINIFSKMRMYLATPVIAQNATGPRDLAFDPVDSWYSGASLDAHLQARRDNGTEVMLVLETVPPYMGVPGHAVAAPPGADTKSPASFSAHAEMAFQITARYGSRAVPLDQIKIRSTQTKKTGLGILKRLQPYNETWEFWEGGPRTFVRPDGTTETRSVGDWAPEEEVAMMTAVYNRVKQADPNMIVVWPSWLKPDPNQMNRAKAWADVVNGGKLPCDELAFTLWWNNTYPSSTNYTQTLDFGGGGGKHPEILGGLKEYCDTMVDQVQALFPGVNVIVTENGYDSEPTPQSVPEIAGKTRRLVQAEWLVRSYLAIFASKVKALYHFMMEDSTEGGLFSSCGLVETDNTKAKPSWYYTATVIDVLRNAVFEEQPSSGHPDVRIYRFRDVVSQKTIYALWCPTASGRTVGQFPLSVPGTSATLVKLADKSVIGQRSTLVSSSGAVRVDVSESPVFVIVN